MRETLLLINGENAPSTKIVDATGRHEITLHPDPNNHPLCITSTTEEHKDGVGSVYFPRKPTASPGALQRFLWVSQSPDWGFGTNPFTIDCWVMYGSDTNSKIVCLCGLAKYYGYVPAGINWIWYLVRRSGPNKWGLNFKATSPTYVEIDIFDEFSMSPDVWNRLSIVRNRDTITQYVNGNALSYHNIGDFFLPEYTEKSMIVFWDVIDGGEEYLNTWYLDDFAIYSYAKSFRVPKGVMII